VAGEKEYVSGLVKIQLGTKDSFHTSLRQHPVCVRKPSPRISSP
jgi:hypothetical protein